MRSCTEMFPVISSGNDGRSPGSRDNHVGAVGSLLFSLATPASAADYRTSEFFVCGPWCFSGNVEVCDYTYGTITWYNRTAGVTGQVIDGTTNPDDYTVAIFEAFAGATKIDSESRTANLPAVPDGAAGRFACDIGG